MLAAYININNENNVVNNDDRKINVLGSSGYSLKKVGSQFRAHAYASLQAAIAQYHRAIRAWRPYPVPRHTTRTSPASTTACALCLKHTCLDAAAFAAACTRLFPASACFCLSCLNSSYLLHLACSATACAIWAPTSCAKRIAHSFSTRITCLLRLTALPLHCQRTAALRAYHLLHLSRTRLKMTPASHALEWTRALSAASFFNDKGEETAPRLSPPLYPALPTTHTPPHKQHPLYAHAHLTPLPTLTASLPRNEG